MFFLALLLAGCAHGGSQAEKEKVSGAYLTFADDAGNNIVLQQPPQRVVVLSSSMLNMVDAVGGNLAGRSTSKNDKLPERFKDVPEVGPVYNISVEKLVSLNPDLILGNANQHEKFKDVVGANKVPFALFKVRTYEDVKRALKVVGKIYGKPDVAEEKIKELDAQIAQIAAKLPQGEKKRALIIHATPNNVTVETTHSIAGNCLELLGQQNVAKIPGGKEEQAKIPYSIETLVEANPDVIFITSMGSGERVKNRLRQDVESSPVWQALPAVREGRVYVLPENYFLLNPGLDFPKAVELMARDLYPEVFK